MPSQSTTATVPHKRIGIVGGGFGGLITYTVLRWRGVPARDIVVFSPETSPEKSWARLVRAIGQRDMRSESIGHFYPTDSPGLATMAALHQWSIKPLVLSWFDAYRPSVEVMIDHARQLAQQTGFWSSLIMCRVGSITKHHNKFYIHADDGQLCGIVEHVVLAVGHGARAQPAPVSTFWQQHPADPRVVDTFAAKDYHPDKTVLVIGDGLTAATEWHNAFEHGSRVVGLSRHGFTFGQPLNTPRRYFSKRGFAPYRRLSDAERVRMLAATTRGTIPNYPQWRRLFEQQRERGALKLITGELVSIDAAPAELHVSVRLSDGHSLLTLMVDEVICATGFQPATTHPLLQQLCRDHPVATTNGVLKLDDNFCIPALSSPGSCAAVVGAAAAWSIPAADSLVGMKIAARAIADRIVGPNSWYPQELVSKTTRWARLVTNHAL